MRWDHKGTPTCNYYPFSHCEHPKDCSIHGPPLMRPRMRRHLLHAVDRAPRSWVDKGVDPMTLCGLWLHNNSDTVSALLKRQSLVASGEMTLSQAFFANEAQERDRLWHAGPRISSTDPDYVVHHLYGSDREALIATKLDAVTCKRCWTYMRVRRFDLVDCYRFGVKAPITIFEHLRDEKAKGQS